MWIILLATFLISLGSLIGVLTLSLDQKRLQRGLYYFVALSCGAMMGAAFLHLLPEAIELLPGKTALTITLFSFIGFFIIEKGLHWRHCHQADCDQHSFGFMNLIGDGIHNFLDGLIIAATFTSGSGLGWATVLAIALHEIPQEISDYGVLLYSGWSRKQALIANFLVALTAVAGGLIGYYLTTEAGFSSILTSIAAGGFIYIAASDLLPEIRKETSLKKSGYLFAAFLFGILLMMIFKN